MKKHKLYKYILLFSIFIISASSTAGIIYFVYHNSKVTHDKKYKLEEYKKDQKEIKLKTSTHSNTQSAQQIFNNFNNFKARYPKKESINQFISSYVKADLTPRQNKNLIITFTDLKFDHKNPDYLIFDYVVNDIEHKFPEFKVNNARIIVWKNSFDYENDEALKKSILEHKSELINIVTNTKASEIDYYNTEEFKNSIFNWFKKIADLNRPNLYPIKDFDIIKPENNDYVKYIIKKERNLLTINYIFVSKTDPKLRIEQKFQYYVK